MLSKALMKLVADAEAAGCEVETYERDPGEGRFEMWAAGTAGDPDSVGVVLYDDGIMLRLAPAHLGGGLKIRRLRDARALLRLDA